MRIKQGTPEWREKMEYLFFKKGNNIRNSGRTRFKKGYIPLNKGKRSGIIEQCICGGKFYKLPSQKKKFCSIKCWNIYKKENNIKPIFKKKVGKRKTRFPIQKICGVCNKEFTTLRNIAKFCSRECLIEATGFKKGHKQKEEWIEKQRIQVSGDKCWLWKGGLNKPYGLEFNNQLRGQIRKRDNYICQQCNFKQKQLKYKLSVHHIDYNKQNNNLNNLVSLCKVCHSQTNYIRKDWIDYFQNKLEVKNEI